MNKGGCERHAPFFILFKGEESFCWSVCLDEGIMRWDGACGASAFLMRRVRGMKKPLPDNVRGGAGLCVCVGECFKTPLLYHSCTLYSSLFLLLFLFVF